ncbi:MAG: sensor histidine kinase [Bacillaceae bacterium]
MLLILMLFLLISSILVLIVKRNKETFYIFGMCITLAIMLSGILLYISKKGGISRDLQNFFFFSIEIKTKLQYFLITLDELGFMIAFGRYLFPMFLMLLAVQYTMVSFFRMYPWIKRLIFLFPIVTLTLYYPSIFRFLAEQVPGLKIFIIVGTYSWILLFIFIAICLLLYEAYSIKLKFLQRQFVFIIAFVLSLTALYLIYFLQEPIQVYEFYFYEYHWTRYYMNSVLSVPTYISIILLNVVLAIVGFGSLLKYTHQMFETDKQEINIQKKFDAISTGTSIFVHSIKNQLLANRVLFKRLKRDIESDMDKEALKKSIVQLTQQNENMLKRIEELYLSVKSNSIRLVPINVTVVIENAVDRFHSKFSNRIIQVDIKEQAMILADSTHLSEAIYNLLTNAQEAIGKKADNGEVIISTYTDNLYMVIEVKDNGVGICKQDLKKICEPYFSKKNSNSNWGMGLYYVNSIVKEHFGTLRFESIEGAGSTFYILLPKI